MSSTSSKDTNTEADTIPLDELDVSQASLFQNDT
jgi:hypothetical protein